MTANNKKELITRYEIKSERLRMVPVVDSDAENVFSFTSNSNVTRWLTCETHNNIDNTKTFIRNLNKADSKYCTWAIRERNKSRVIGLINFIRSSNSQAEVHYMLAEEFWNQGLTTEAVNSIILYLKKFYPQIVKITSDPLIVNTASCRVLEKCGFRKADRRLVRWNKYYPRYSDVFCYELNLDNR